MKYLNVLTLNLTRVMFAFDKNEKLRAERGECGSNVYDVLTIRAVERR